MMEKVTSEIQTNICSLCYEVNDRITIVAMGKICPLYGTKDKKIETAMKNLHEYTELQMPNYVNPMYRIQEELVAFEEHPSLDDEDDSPESGSTNEDWEFQSTFQKAAVN